MVKIPGLNFILFQFLAIYATGKRADYCLVRNWLKYQCTSLLLSKLLTTPPNYCSQSLDFALAGQFYDRLVMNTCSSHTRDSSSTSEYSVWQLPKRGTVFLSKSALFRTLILSKINWKPVLCKILFNTRYKIVSRRYFLKILFGRYFNIIYQLYKSHWEKVRTLF